MSALRAAITRVRRPSAGAVARRYRIAGPPPAPSLFPASVALSAESVPSLASVASEVSSEPLESAPSAYLIGHYYRCYRSVDCICAVGRVCIISHVYSIGHVAPSVTSTASVTSAPSVTSLRRFVYSVACVGSIGCICAVGRLFRYCHRFGRRHLCYPWVVVSIPSVEPSHELTGTVSAASQTKPAGHSHSSMHT